MDAAPRIETARLLLRSSTQADLDAHAAMLGDDGVMHHLTGAGIPREDAWRRLLQGPGLWVMLGYGYWSVERREDGKYIGQLGFADFKRELEPSIEGVPEMGWLFAAEAQGQGFALEGVTAALAWADEVLRAAEIVAIIAPDNARSIRLAERTGFFRAEETLYKRDPSVIFRRRYKRNESAAAAT
ncbi:MAG TPA: GNAT family N-acetyltransferase [Allosphingosinicella sp.]|jgi:RimJ/RimL family protein N-acetyltransferase